MNLIQSSLVKIIHQHHPDVSLGLHEEARAEAEEVLRIYPGFSLDYYAEILPLKNQADVDYVISSLRKAGLK